MSPAYIVISHMNLNNRPSNFGLKNTQIITPKIQQKITDGLELIPNNNSFLVDSINYI